MCVRPWVCAYTYENTHAYKSHYPVNIGDEMAMRLAAHNRELCYRVCPHIRTEILCMRAYDDCVSARDAGRYSLSPVSYFRTTPAREYPHPPPTAPAWTVSPTPTLSPTSTASICNFLPSSTPLPSPTAAAEADHRVFQL